ncbi:28S ribosomal protein S33, mitochondrial isoform X1 [Grus americana]|nr:28S ribosomal protein S33, mitochondrial isoform X1 [Grus americana]
MPAPLEGSEAAELEGTELCRRAALGRAWLRVPLAGRCSRAAISSPCGRGKIKRKSICLCVPALPWEMSNVSSYALRMARLSAQIFGEVVRPTDSKSMKVVKLFSEQPLAKKKEVYSWYPPHNTYYALMKKLRYFGLYRDEHQDFKEEMRRLKKLRGKEKPKKGEGKRALKKK